MDGRTSALLALGLGFACSGCVTSQKTASATVRRAEEAAAPAVVGKAETAKRPAPARLVLAFAELKENGAEAAKLTPEEQAKLRDEARRVYQDLLKADASNVEAYRGLGRVYTKMGDYDRAVDTYQKGLATHPRDVVLWHDLGMLHNRRKDWAEASRCLRKGLEIDPENQKCLKTLGFTLARAGNAEQGLPYLTRAMGSAAAAHYNIALMLLHLGEGEQSAQRPQLEIQARQHLRQALRENPNLDRAGELLASLDAPEQGPGNVRHATLRFSMGQ